MAAADADRKARTSALNRVFALVATLVSGCTVLTEPPVLSADATSLAAAESAFAAQSVREGMRAAFLSWLAPQGTIYRPGPVNGPAYIAANPDPPIVLGWRPVFVEVAASGEMGLSTGPWTLKSRGDPSAPPRHGQFVSVWKREARGPWRVHVDLGISHRDPALDREPLRAATPTAARGATAESLREAEARFARLAAEAGDASAYGRYSSPTIRLYREGHAPFLGYAAALHSPAAREAGTRWTVENLEASASGEFGYVMGRFGASGSDAVEGYFLRVWRLEQEGWRIALDVVNIAPPRAAARPRQSDP